MCCCCLINAAHVQHRSAVESSHRTCSSSLTIFAIVSAIVNDIICRLNSAICIAKWVPPHSLSLSLTLSATVSFSLVVLFVSLSPHNRAALLKFFCMSGAFVWGYRYSGKQLQLLFLLLLLANRAMYLCAACTASYATTATTAATTTAGAHLCSMTTATSSWQHGRGQSLAGINARPTFQCQPSAQRYQSSC